MRRPITLPISLAVLLLASLTSAHTWIEKISIIASNGTFVGSPGWPRGFVPRDPGVNPALANQYLLPPNGRANNAFLPSDLICRTSQLTRTTTTRSPSLVAAPGDNIALTYLENGHVTLHQNIRPSGNGTVFIYGTTQSADTDTYLGIHRVWNEAGTGGDKRGKLLATRTFDDGQCYQINDSPLSASRKAANPVDAGDLPCQSDLQLPSDAPTSGLYTLYWVWEWPRLDESTGAIAANESYTTCIDISMTSNKFPDAGSFVSDQPAMSRAISPELSNAFMVNPTQLPELPSPAGVAVSSSAASTTAAPVPATSVVSSAVGTGSSANTASTTTISLLPASSATRFPYSTSTGLSGMLTVTVTETAPASIITQTVYASAISGGSTSLPTTPSGSTTSVLTASILASSATTPSATSSPTVSSSTPSTSVTTPSSPPTSQPTTTSVPTTDSLSTLSTSSSTATMLSNSTLSTTLLSTSPASTSTSTSTNNPTTTTSQTSILPPYPTTSSTTSSTSSLPAIGSTPPLSIAPFLSPQSSISAFSAPAAATAARRRAPRGLSG